MAAYLARRLIGSVLILIGVSFITFFLLYVLPADPVRQIAGRSATPETVESIRQHLGLDQSFIVQYGRYLGALVQGDLGRSYLQRTEVAELIWSRLPATLLLMVAAIFCELLIGLTLGVTAALYRGRPLDQVLMVSSFVAVSAPQFVVSLLLLYVFAVKLGWFPIGGYGTFAHLVLPALTLGMLGSGWYSRMMRSSMIDVLHADFIRTARAKGLSESSILLKHALKNAFLPVLSYLGPALALAMTGSFVVERVFNVPGMGQHFVNAVLNKDLFLIMGVVLIYATLLIVFNIAVDVLYRWVDPRIE